jgi:hypothetical protein
MKTTITLLLLAFFSIGVKAQYALPVDFETPEEDTNWIAFANNPDAPEDLTIVENPDKSGINTSDYCAKHIVNETADQWAGAVSTAYGVMEFTADQHTMQMMVYKEIISPCGMKVEQSTDGGANLEVKVSNTVTGEWELLTFDLSDAIGYTYPALVFFPDFPDEARTAGSINHVDNLGWATASSLRKVNDVFLSVYPNPANDAITIQYPGMRKVTISNMVGQGIRSLEFQLTDHKVVDISSLEAGVYFITLDTANGIVSTKFVKQ